MSKCVAGFSFRKGHGCESVTGVFSFRREYDRESEVGVAGLYRVRAVCFFPVPEIPEGKHERLCNRFFLRREA